MYHLKAQSRRTGPWSFLDAAIPTTGRRFRKFKHLERNRPIVTAMVVP
jgi:hypothetical protein